MLQTRSLYHYFSWRYSQNRFKQSNSSYLFILVSMVTLHLKLLLVKILDLISFHMLQTRSLYVSYEQSYSQNRFNQSKFSFLFILVSMVTHNQILLLVKILNLISFHMLQTRSLYHYFSWSYSQNRLNQSKCSISDSMVTMVTIIIYACYAVQRFKPDVSTLNMKEDIAIWKMSRDLVRHFGFFLYTWPFYAIKNQKWLVNIFFHLNHLKNDLKQPLTSMLGGGQGASESFARGGGARNLGWWGGGARPFFSPIYHFMQLKPKIIC